MTIEDATLVLAGVTALLVMATGVLAFISYRQLEAQKDAVAKQAELQTRAIEAQLLVVEEMRKEALDRNPFAVSLTPRGKQIAGTLSMGLTNTRKDVSVVVERLRVEQPGTDMTPYEAGLNARLGAGDSYPLQQPYRQDAPGTEVVVSAWGFPEGGERTLRTFHFRVKPDGHLKDLQVASWSYFSAAVPSP